MGTNVIIEAHILNKYRLLLEIQDQLQQQGKQSFLAQVLHKDHNAEQLKFLSEHIDDAFNILMVSLDNVKTKAHYCS